MRIITTISLIIILMISVHGNSQTHWIGLQRGINITSVDAKENFGDTRQRFSYIDGFNYEYLAPRNLILGLDFLYNPRGFREDVLFSNEEGSIVNESIRVNFDYDYISIPLSIGFAMGDKYRLIPKAGIIPSYLLKAEYKRPEIEINGLRIEEEIINISDEFTKFDLSGQVSLEGNYSIQKNGKLFITATYRRSLTNVVKSDYFETDKMKHFGLSISIGLKYSLTKGKKEDSTVKEKDLAIQI